MLSLLPLLYIYYFFFIHLIIHLASKMSYANIVKQKDSVPQETEAMIIDLTSEDEFPPLVPKKKNAAAKVSFVWFKHQICHFFIIIFYFSKASLPDEPAVSSRRRQRKSRPKKVETEWRLQRIGSVLYNGQSHVINHGLNSIGADENNDIIVDSKFSSGKHYTIYRDDDTIKLTNLVRNNN